MAALYFPELTFELIEWAKALMGIPFSQEDDTLRFWLPADDLDGLTVVVFELPVNFSHNALALRLKTPQLHAPYCGYIRPTFRLPCAHTETKKHPGPGTSVVAVSEDLRLNCSCGSFLHTR